MLEVGLELRHAGLLALPLGNGGICVEPAEGKDVHEDALIVFRFSAVVIDESRAVLEYLCPESREPLGVGRGMQRIAFREQRRCDFAEAVKVILGHPNVDIVIPGDKAAMAYGSQQRAAVDEVVDTVFAADSIDDGDDFKVNRLQALQ